MKATRGGIAELLLDQGPACSWALNRELKFIEARGNTVPLFGRTADALAGQSLPTVLDAGTMESWRDRIAGALAGEQRPMRALVGPAVYAITHFPLRDPLGAIEMAGGFGHEITSQYTAEDELRSAVLKVIKGQEEDRARISQVLHDDVGQCLSAAGLRLDLLRMDLQQAVPDLPQRTADIQELLDHAVQRVRELSYELNPNTVERTGMQHSLEMMVNRMRRKFLGTLRMAADPEIRPAPAVASALYRIASEAVENAVEHAGANNIEVALRGLPDGVGIEVRDDGIGFDHSDLLQARRGLGLFIMEHCAGQTDLRLTISSGRGKGTLVRAIQRTRNGAAS